MEKKHKSLDISTLVDFDVVHTEYQGRSGSALVSLEYGTFLMVDVLGEEGRVWIYDPLPEGCAAYEPAQADRQRVYDGLMAAFCPFDEGSAGRDLYRLAYEAILSPEPTPEQRSVMDFAMAATQPIDDLLTEKSFEIWQLEQQLEKKKGGDE